MKNNVSGLTGNLLSDKRTSLQKSTVVITTQCEWSVGREWVKN